MAGEMGMTAAAQMRLQAARLIAPSSDLPSQQLMHDVQGRWSFA
jgi:hypothetical protein